MSITIERSKFMPCIPIYDSPRFPAERVGDMDSCSSSSIGRNSDSSAGSSDGGDESGGESEVQSSYKGPLDTMNALEEVLPLKYVFFGYPLGFIFLGHALILLFLLDNKFWFWAFLIIIHCLQMKLIFIFFFFIV
jgi:hypothetical protein